MRKSSILVSLVLAMSFLSGCGGNASQNNSGSSAVDLAAKQAFLKCKEKVDIVKTSISELTMEESGEYSESSRIKRDNNRCYNELTKERYLSLQNFGLYILNNVYHCVTFGYDSENIGLETIIYDEVNNELDANLRNYLKSQNLYTQFYMQIEKGDSDYLFSVDWLGKEGLRGGIYVNGKIEMSGGDVTRFTVTSYTQDESTFVFAAHYDFVSCDFYMFNFSCDRDSGMDLLEDTFAIIDKFNNVQLELTDLEEKNYNTIALCSGKITKDVSEINYQGYARNSYFDIPSNREVFAELFNGLKGKFTAAKVRTSRVCLDYSESTRVHYMDAALNYGLETSKLYVTDWGSAIFPFVGPAEFSKMSENVPSTYAEIFAKAKNKLSSAKSDNSIVFEDDEIKIGIEVKNEQYFYLNTFTVDSLAYSITDKVKEEKITFSVKGDSIVNIKTVNMDTIPADDPNYEEVITVAHPFGNSDSRLLENAAYAFNQKYKNKYKIRLHANPSIADGIINRIGTGAVDELPDLALINSVELTKLVSNENCRKYLYDFDSVINDENVGFNEEEIDKFDKKMFDDTNNYSVEGRWCLPYSSSDYYLMYDPTYFEGDEKQFDLPNTFEDLIEICSMLKSKKGSGFTPLYVDCDSDFILNLMAQKNMPIFSSDAKSIEFIREENKNQLLDFMNELSAYLTYGLITTKGITGSYLGNFDTSKHAFAIIRIKDVNSGLGDNYKLAPIPYANSNQVYIRSQGINGFSLLKTGKPYAVRGAWLFVKEFLNQYGSTEPLSRKEVPAIDYSSEETGNIYIDSLVAVSKPISNCYSQLPKIDNIDTVFNELTRALRDIKSNNSVRNVVERLIATLS